MPFVCGDHATVLLFQGSPVSYLRQSNSDAAFTLKDFVLYVLLCFLFVVMAEKMNFEL